MTAAEIEKLLNDRLKITDDKIDAVLRLNTPTLEAAVQKEVTKQLGDVNKKLDDLTKLITEIKNKK